MQRLSAQIPEFQSGLTRELLLRYFSATMVTLLALAGAQLLVRTDFVLLLAFVTLLGTPVSMGLRLRSMRVGSVSISRPVWNSITVLATMAVAGFYLAWVLRGFLEGWNGSMQSFWLRFGAGDSMGLLIQVFLIFAAFRSFALISDKDCTLATVPSFSVLLLLIPVHKGIEVVAYFVVWTFFAAILFALDHRSELHAQVVGVASARGASTRMAARSLSSILSFSLAGAIAFSAFLATRNPDDKSEAETAITALATRLTQMALALPEVSANGGPERQIDFSSGPSLPTQTVLWQSRAVSLDDRTLRPQYLRLFSLSEYNGTSWSQNNIGQKSVKRKMLRRFDWPLELPAKFRPQPTPSAGESNGYSPTFEVNGSASTEPRLQNLHPSRRLTVDFGFGTLDARRRPAFGGPTMGVRQIVRAQINNLGFVPLLPLAQTLRLRDSDQDEIRVRRDGAVDVGVTGAGQTVRAFSVVPRLKEYGFPSGNAPAKKVAPHPNAPVLTAAERAATLKLPLTLPRRVAALGREMLRESRLDDSNLRRAQRLALRLGEDAIYTLRPPAVPNSRDAADYFLFEGNKRGYCTYFAGALAVLCRTQGIPARVATGFAGMEYRDGDFAIVREANAHAWTEVWVENWGWASVDATPADDRGDNAPTWIENWGDAFGAVFDNTSRTVKMRWPLVLLATALFSGLIFAFMRRAQLRRFLLRRTGREQESELARREILEIYRVATRSLTKRFRARKPSETPNEWLHAALQAHPQRGGDALQTLTAIYLRAAFSPAPIDEQSLRIAREVARKLKSKGPTISERATT